MAATGLAVRAPAMGVPLPSGPGRVRLAPPPHTERPDGTNPCYSMEEFDFSDVFGPAASHSLCDEHEPLDGTLQSNEPPLHFAHFKEGTMPPSSEAEAGMASWAPRDSISDGSPHVIFNRSHSLMGPVVTPRGSYITPEDPAFPHLASSDSVQQIPESTPKPVSDDSSPRISPVHSADKKIDATGSNADRRAEANHKIGPSDFENLRVVGQGAFGKVFQVQKKSTGEIFAMKVMRKDRIVEKNQEDYMKAEKEILTKVYHPFIVQLQYSFQTESKLYLILDFINGGHLFFQLYRQGTFCEELARIYTAELILAVEHLHNLGIVHRDLKPENILLDCDGHVKLTDFGIAKQVNDSTSSNSMCGTMEYMAPEIILAKGHGKAADWWSIGILLYEMLTGQPPYIHKNRQKLQQKIAKEKFKLPPYLSSDVHSLLKGLLQKNPQLRLGSAKGAAEIKNHKWFCSIDWVKLEAKKIQPSFRPDVKGKECTANFDEIWTNLPVQESPAGTPNGIDHSIFRGYTYVAPDVWLPTLDSDSQGEEDDENELSDQEGEGSLFQ